MASDQKVGIMLDQFGGGFAAGAAILAAISTLIAILALWDSLRLQARWARLLKSADEMNLESLLLDHLHDRNALSSQVESLGDRLTTIESKMSNAKRYLGYVRYDAFPDVGGKQSFSLALYDETGHGLVLSSLVGRTHTRIYCKEIVGGQASRDMTDEERRAIEDAAVQRAKALIGA